MNKVRTTERKIIMEKCKYCEEDCGLKADGEDYSTLEIDVAERELSIWEGDECVMLFTISYCPVCGRRYI